MGIIRESLQATIQQLARDLTTTPDWDAYP